MSDQAERPKQAKYVVVTPVHNGERTLERTIRSVVSQTVLPLRFVIVSDGSTDGTDEIARKYAHGYEWIRFVRREKPSEEAERMERAAPGKAGAFQLAVDQLVDLEFDYIACLDDDVDLPADYYRVVIEEFEKDLQIGICGGALRNILPDGSVGPGGFWKPDFVAARSRCSAASATETLAASGRTASLIA